MGNNITVRSADIINGVMCVYADTVPPPAGVVLVSGDGTARLALKHVRPRSDAERLALAVLAPENAGETVPALMLADEVIGRAAADGQAGEFVSRDRLVEVILHLFGATASGRGKWLIPTDAYELARRLAEGKS